MLQDKRQLRRHRKRLQIRFGVGTANRYGFTEDISDTGLFIKSAIVQNPNAVILVDLTAPDGTLIRLTGRVMWAKKVPPNLLRRLKGGMGVRILEFQDGAEAYRQLCTELNSRAG